MSPRLVILDRDGVLNEEHTSGWVTRVQDWRWLPGALDALRRLGAGRSVMVATNQSCVGRGLATAAQIEVVHAHLIAEAQRAQAHVDRVFACMHAPGEGCTCRKPAPGMLLEALAVAGVQPHEALFVGDSMTDAQAAKAAGVRFALVRTGKGRDTEARGVGDDVAVFDDLLGVARALGEGAAHRRA